MKKSSESGSRPNEASRVLRISPLGKLDERKLKPDAEPFKRAPNADFFDIGTLVWSKVLKNGTLASESSSDPYLRAFPLAAAKIAGSSEILPTAEDLVTAYFSLNAACRDFETRIPGWRLSLSMGLLSEKNGFDANEVDLSDAYGLESDFESDTFFRSVWSEISKLPEIETYRTVVFDFFWPAGLYQILPLAKKFKSMGKKVVLNFTRANEQSDFTVWIEAFKKNPEIFERLDAVVVYEDYGHAMDEILRAFANGEELGADIENAVRMTENGVEFKKPGAVDEDELFRRFEKYFHSSSKDRKIAGRKISTVRLFPYKCYWSSCFFCTINSTHLYAYKKRASAYVDSCLDYVEKNGIRYLYLADEAIHPDDILEFARKVLERKLDLVYRFRARFDAKFDRENCELLAKSGARYVGIGLECASDRVSELINKGNELTLEKKTEIIGNFERAGIPFHNYAILGLPGERQEEMYETYLFLSKNVRERDNYTCSPNVFWLNKGSAYEKHGDKFGVETKASAPVSKTSLKLRIEMARTALFSDAQRQFALEIHRQQFLEFCSKELVAGTVPRDFWDFIDRTGLFYHLKSFSRESPYRKPIREAAELSKLPGSELLGKKFALSEYLRERPDGNGYAVRNIATWREIRFQNPGTFEKWDAGLPLYENLRATGTSENLKNLIEYRFILPHG